MKRGHLIGIVLAAAIIAVMVWALHHSRRGKGSGTVSGSGTVPVAAAGSGSEARAGRNWGPDLLEDLPEAAVLFPDQAQGRALRLRRGLHLTLTEP